jgi:hypothetical protein
MPIMFNTVLKSEGVDPTDVRLVRHHDTRPECKNSPYALWKRDPALLNRYQSLQSNEVFKVGNTLASFVRTPAGQTLFVGLYRVDGKGESDESDVDPSSDIACPGVIKYTISRDDRLKDMAGRLVVDWGKGYLAWVQLGAKNNKKVLELGRDPDDKPFPGYFASGCRLSELAELPPGWITQLSRAKGIYVLTSLTTREHYVGSASGLGGFFGRWQQHAKAGGDAVAFKGLAASEYRISILQVSAGFETDEDIIKTENAWMEKLQSRKMGLNGNPGTAIAPEPET